MLEACEEVQKSKKFRGVLEVVLAVGNYINGGTHRGAAYGFKLDALTKLQVPTTLLLSLSQSHHDASVWHSLFHTHWPCRTPNRRTTRRTCCNTWPR